MGTFSYYYCKNFCQVLNTCHLMVQFLTIAESYRKTVTEDTEAWGTQRDPDSRHGNCSESH